MFQPNDPPGWPDRAATGRALTRRTLLRQGLPLVVGSALLSPTLRHLAAADDDAIRGPRVPHQPLERLSPES